MRAVNLIPRDANYGGSSAPTSGRALTYGVLGALAAVLGLVTLYVLTNNTIAERQAKLSDLNTELVQAQAQASHLGNYSQFAQLAQTRVLTVRELAATRFDWHGAMTELARVVPANASLQSLVATVAPGSGTGGAGGSSSLRGAISVPAFELGGCTATHDDVARLMSRLRLIDGVTRVTLNDSQKSGSSQGGASVSSTSGSGGASGQGCAAGGANFDLVIFFKALPGAGAAGASSISASPSGTAAGTSPTASSTTQAQPAGTTTTTPSSTTSTPAAATTTTSGSAR